MRTVWLAKVAYPLEEYNVTLGVFTNRDAAEQRCWDDGGWINHYSVHVYVLSGYEYEYVTEYPVEVIRS